MPTVNYLQVIGWEHVAAKRAERNEGYIGKTTKASREAYEDLHICTFGDAWISKMVAKQQGYHSIAPADNK